MKPSELRKKSKKDLEKILDEKRRTLMDLRFNLTAGKLKKVREIREIKKDIARILTVMKLKT
jgi:large subunit ribosomal protein L29